VCDHAGNALQISGLGLAVPDPEAAPSTNELLPTLVVLHAVLASVTSAKKLCRDDVTICKVLLSESFRKWGVRIPRLYGSTSTSRDAVMTDALVRVGRFQRLCYGLVWGAAEKAASLADALEVRLIASYYSTCRKLGPLDSPCCRMLRAVAL
jgi:hypothetical protein